MNTYLTVNRNLNSWNVFNIVSAACLISLWPVLAFFTLPLRILITEGQIPFFFFLIWFAGLTKNSYFAFAISFLGHMFFDLVFFFNPFFFFIWIASGCAAALISQLKTRKKTLWIVALVFMPLLYLGAFSVVGSFFFSFRRFFWLYFVAFPQITVFLVIINPIFNVFTYFVLVNNKVLQKMILLNGDGRLSWIKISS